MEFILRLLEIALLSGIGYFLPFPNVENKTRLEIAFGIAVVISLFFYDGYVFRERGKDLISATYCLPISSRPALGCPKSSSWPDFFPFMLPDNGDQPPPPKVRTAQPNPLYSPEQNASNAMYWKSLGDEAYAGHDFKAAISNYKWAIGDKKDYVAAIVNLGNAHFENRDLIEAKVDYDNAIAIDPNLVAARLDRENDNMILMGFAAFGALADALTKTKSKSPSVGSGMAKQILDDCTVILRIDPNSARAYHDRGTIEKSFGYTGAADLDFARAKAIDPNIELDYGAWKPIQVN